MQVELRDVIEAIEFENELLSHYYNKETGVIIYKEDKSTASVTSENITNIDDYESWQKELIMELKDLEDHPEKYIKLPGTEELHEGRMMKKFMKKYSLSCDADEEEIEELKKVIEGKCLLNEWYDFRKEQEKEIAINWCKENNIEYL